MGLTTPRELRWDDPGAPVLDGQVGSFYTLIKTFLVSCGWSIAWDEPANYKIVLRNSMAHGGSGCYVRVLDDGSFAGGAMVARIDVYESMSDIDTGTETAGGGYVWKDRTGSGGPNAYTVNADERTAYIGAYVGGSSPPVMTSGFASIYLSWAGVIGDIDPAIAGDPGVICALMTSDNPPTGTQARVISPIFGKQGSGGVASVSGVTLSRGNSLTAAVTNCAVMEPSNAGGGIGIGGNASLLGAAPSPGMLGPLFIPALVLAGTYRGRLRGCFLSLNSWAGGGTHVGSVHTPVATSAALSLATLAGSPSTAANDNGVGRLFVERALSWDDV